MTLDQWLSMVNICVTIIVALITYHISKKLSVQDKYNHEISISNQMQPLLGRKVILADVKKYNPDNNDLTNESYYKQACSVLAVIPVYGVRISLRDSYGFKEGTIPFDWIEYVRTYDSEDSVAIIVCKFHGIKWYKNFKSPIKEIN